MKVSPFGKSETKTKGRKSRSINRPVFRLRLLRWDCNPPIFEWKSFSRWRDSFQTRLGDAGQTEPKRNEIRVYPAFIRRSRERHCSISRENKFFQKFFFHPHFRWILLEIRFRFGINSLFIHILYYFRFSPCVVVRFIYFLLFNFIFRDFISVYFIFWFTWFVNKKNGI